MNNNQIRIGGFGSANDLNISNILRLTLSNISSTFTSPEVKSYAKNYNICLSITSKTDIW